jgi:type I restriction-modification system DNA methylase subunit
MRQPVPSPVARVRRQVSEPPPKGRTHPDVYIQPYLAAARKLEEIRKHDHVLTPGRYVGAEAQADDGEPFDTKMKRLTSLLEEQFAESARLEKEIWKNLKELEFGK